MHEPTNEYLPKCWHVVEGECAPCRHAKVAIILAATPRDEVDYLEFWIFGELDTLAVMLAKLDDTAYRFHAGYLTRACEEFDEAGDDEYPTYEAKRMREFLATVQR